jgi:NAD(P)-dependent dehydrogenase (short-subunit alcohol dehydrogenase family)
MAPPARVALVTGAAGGIGRATVDALMRGGFAVAAVDLALADLPCAFDAPFESISADVTDESAVAGAVERCVRRFGGIDCVVHLAGAVGRGPLVEVSAADWRRLLDVNLTSAFLLAKAVHPHLRDRRGTIVLVSSTNGLNGGSALSGPAYAVAKAGVLNLVRYLAKEWGAEGIRVNAVAPGPVGTPMLARLPEATREALQQSIPLGRLASAGDVAGVIAFLCSPQAEYLTGTVLNVSGGLVLD